MQGLPSNIKSKIPIKKNWGTPSCPPFNPILTGKSANIKYFIERLVVEF